MLYFDKEEKCYIVGNNEGIINRTEIYSMDICELELFEKRNILYLFGAGKVTTWKGYIMDISKEEYLNKSENEKYDYFKYLQLK